MNHERVLAALDAEVASARRRLEQLTTARSTYAAAHGLTGRKAVTSPDGGPVAGSLATVVLRVMRDGADWRVDDVTAAVQAERSTTRASVNATLYRGSLEGGPFVRGERRGTYRVRPEIAAQWAGAKAA